MAAPPPPAALNLAGKMFFGSLCAGTFGLGCWQTQRLVEKQGLMTQRQEELAMDPVEYNATADSISENSSKKSFRRFVLHGTFRHEHEFLVGPRGPPAGALPDAPGSSAKGMSSAPQGYFVITPMELTTREQTTEQSTGWFGRRSSNSDNEASSAKNYVLVNRGWVPRTMVADDSRQRNMRQQPQQQQLENSNLLQWNRPTEPVQVVGVVTETERTYVGMNPEFCGDLTMFLAYKLWLLTPRPIFSHHRPQVLGRRSPTVQSAAETILV